MTGTEPCQRRTGGRRIQPLIGALYGSKAHRPSERCANDSKSAGPSNQGFASGETGRSGVVHWLLEPKAQPRTTRAGLMPLDSMPRVIINQRTTPCA